jgi:hypothetical protein
MSRCLVIGNPLRGLSLLAWGFGRINVATRLRAVEFVKVKIEMIRNCDEFNRHNLLGMTQNRMGLVKFLQIGAILGRKLDVKGSDGFF